MVMRNCGFKTFTPFSLPDLFGRSVRPAVRHLPSGAATCAQGMGEFEAATDGGVWVATGATVKGVPTWALKGRFNAGEVIEDIAADFVLEPEDVKKALAFEGITVH
jgi:hypothetical protein